MVHTMKRLQGDPSSLRNGSRRRTYDAAFKRDLVELSLVAGASVAKIALDHRLNANILFKWRRQHLRALARATPKPAAELLPITITGPERTAVEAPARAPGPTPRRQAAAPVGVIEIDLPFGRVRLTGTVDLAALRVVIDALSQR